MKSKNPSYIHKLPSGYIFRYTIPKDIRPYIGKTELRYSLKTGKIGVAIHKAYRMSRVTRCVIKNTREGGSMVELSQEQIQELLSKWFREELEKDEMHRINREPKDKEDAEWHADIIMDIRERFISQLAISD
jgi:hypothetical protein